MNKELKEVVDRIKFNGDYEQIGNGCCILLTEDVNALIEAAENGKDVRVKIWLPSNVKAYSNDPGYRVGHASCAPADVFDIDIGAQIAYARAMKKVWKAIDEYCTNNPHWVEE